MNNGHLYRAPVPANQADRYLVDFLVERYDHSTRSEWTARIADAAVRIDGRIVTAEHRLRAGEQVEWHRPPWREPGAPLDFTILFEDDTVIVVDKPSGLPTLPGANFLQHTLWYQLRRRFADASPMHRLGRFTSGALLCARTGEARNVLTRQFAERSIDKIYRALARGRPEHDRWTAEQSIGPVAYAPTGTLHAASSEGKTARSEIRVVERRSDDFLCDVRIESGRPHQIRIHLAASGHPLVGDPLYRPGGRPDASCRALPGDGGYLLHASRITFGHPSDRRPCRVEAPIPPRLSPTDAT